MSAAHQTTILRAVPPDACLTTAEIAEATGLERKAVTQAVGKLIHRDLIERAEVGCFRLTTAGAAAQADGMELTSAPIKQFTDMRKHRGSLRVRAWRAVRTLGKFTIGDVQAMASREERDAQGGVQRYLLLLERAGYLRRLRKQGRELRYALIRDTGPEAPMVARDRRSVKDMNTKEVHPCSER
jgi:predicted transcriptional regulator of viral defense system